MQRINGLLKCCLVLICLGIATTSYSQEKSLESAKAERAAAGQAAEAAMLKGPQEIALRDQAILKLPEGYGFIPTKEATRFMRSVGNQVGKEFIGLVVPTTGEGFLITIDYNDEGYIKDDDSKKWKADEMLQNLKDGTEEGNQRREDLGLQALQVTRWIEPPKYDASVHHLVWSVEAKLKNKDDPDPSINYNTYILGREGYISMDLITSSSTVETDKQSSATLLAATEFNSGKRYADFNSSTDKVAAYGLAALVGGVALKKLGLLAVFGGLLVKFKAILIAVVAGLGGLVKRFFGKKDATPTSSADIAAPQLPAPTENNSSENKSP